MPTQKDLANALRVLAMDAVQKAKSGHPGAPLGMADMAEVLWNEFFVHNPENPHWVNRDRFILSNGHASMLLYGMLYLSGYDLSLDDIKNFRQLHSKTPGHPELGVTPGVDMTTGPLGQGIASAVGMALAEQVLAAEFNREDFPVIDHFTYVFLGDGCMMEGISHEACSLAGTLKLGKLIALWDDNCISIDGDVKGWFTENTADRFKAYGWHVITDVDGHDAAAVKKALAKARKELDKPSLICCKTIIGKGAPTLAGSAKTHGSPLGDEEIVQAKKLMGWSTAPFDIPAEVKNAWDAKKCGKKAEAKWQTLWEGYASAYPELAAELNRRLKGEMPAGWEETLTEFTASTQKNIAKQASRMSSKFTLDVLGPLFPELLGGSADLTGSVGTLWDGATRITADNKNGRYISYGVREFGMAAMMNGMAVHGGFIPYAGTFLVFSDYMKSAIRTAALMKQRVIHVLTHDSIMVGEDGPTHQPVEQLAGLRLTPGVHVWRPADAVETAVAWRSALLRKDGPTCLALSRQDLPTTERDAKTIKAIEKGGYILRPCKGAPEVILIATGSEVSLAVQAAEILEKRGVRVSVVSMPCPEVFEKQDREWRETVLPYECRARVAIEAGASDWWKKYVGLDGTVVGMSTYGDSAPGKAVYEYFGFTVDRILDAVKHARQACGCSTPCCSGQE